jgi:GNAT superfamily N-acetyltransferase
MSQPADAVLRPATLADLPVIVAMRNRLNALELAGSPHAPIQRLAPDEFAALWGHTFDSSTHCWRIVEVNGEPIGFGLIYLITPKAESRGARQVAAGAFIQWAYLEPEHRRHGLGRVLFEHLLAWARERGVERVELRYIEGNEAAEQFWHKTGFRTFARQCVLWLSPEQDVP